MLKKFFVLFTTLIISMVIINNEVFISYTVAKELSNDWDKNYEEFLPKDAKIIDSSKIIGEDSVIKLDLDNDDKEEILVFYEIDETYEKGFVVLKNINGKLQKIFEDKNKSGKITKIDFLKIYPDGHKNLLIGYFGSTLAGSDYRVYTFNDKDIITLNLSAFNKMDILNTEDLQKGKGFVFGGWWRVGPPELYVINVIRFDGDNFSLAYDFYEEYYKSVVKYFKDKKIENYPATDAMVKAKMYKKALKAIDDGLKIISKNPELSWLNDEWDYYLLKARALNGLKKFDEAKEILECIINNKENVKKKGLLITGQYFSDVYLELGRTYKFLDNKDKAKKYFEKSLDMLNMLDKKGYFSSNIEPNIHKEIKFYAVEQELQNLRK